MFRKIKKLYFKIYHLFKLIGIFIIIFGLSNKVYAEECTNLVTNGEIWMKASTGNFIQELDDRFIKLDEVTQYTIFFDYGEKNFNEIINTTTAVESFQVWHKWGTSFSATNTVDLTKNKYTFWTQQDLNNNNLEYYFRFNGIPNNTATTPFINNETHELWLVKGTEICRTKPEPEPEENIYSNFLTLYLNRITYLAEGFTTNPYLLTMVGIIFGFVVLEITLKILNIRRRKK